MQDAFAPSAAAPLDQADGLRRMFGGARQRCIALIANPHVAHTGVLLERLTAALAGADLQVLLVDAANASPPLPGLALIDLGGCIEPMDAHTSYLPARGLPRAHVDARGSAASLLDALELAAPLAEVVLIHGEAADLARVFQRRDARPILLAADDQESIKYAYAAFKIFAQRCGLVTFDLLLAAPDGARARAITANLASCAERFLGALLNASAVVDPAADAAPGQDLRELLARQLAIDILPGLPAGTAVTSNSYRDRHATTN